MIEKQARKLAVGDGVYDVVRCIEGVVSYIAFNTLTITWANGRKPETLDYDKMQDIEYRKFGG